MTFLRMAGLAIILVVIWTASPAGAADPLPFDLQGARNGGLVFSTQAGEGATKWSRITRLVVTTDTPATTENLKIGSPFIVETEAGVPAELVAEQPPKQDLTAGTSIPLKLSGELPGPGVYRGELVLFQGTRQRVVPIQITVAAQIKPAPMAAPLAEHGAKSVAFTKLPWKARPTDIPISIENTGVEPITLRPMFTSVAQVDKADSPTYQIAHPVPGSDKQSVAQTLGPGEVGKFEVSIPELDEPGIYAVETLFRDPSGKYATYSVKNTVYRRQSSVVAALFILIGALLAAAVRWYSSDGGKRLELRRKIALLVEHVRALRTVARSEAVIQAARVLEMDLVDRDRDARWGNAVDDIDKIVKRAEKRLTLLQDVSDASDQLERIDPAQQSLARKTLDEALVVVRSDVDEQKIDAQRDLVGKLLLRSTLREQLKARLAELVAQLAQQRRTGSDRLKTSLVEIDRQLAGADQLVRTDDLDGLEKLVDAARTALIAASKAELLVLASGPKPLGVEPTDWNAASAAISQKLGGASAPSWENLREAQNIYFAAAVKGLIAESKKMAAGGDPRAARFTEIAAELEAALAKDLVSAAVLYSGHLAEVTAPVPGAIARGPVGALAIAETLIGWFPLILDSSPLARSKLALPGSVELGRAIKATSWVINVIVVVIAVLTGVKALWVDNLSWGGKDAWLIAVLWGAGVKAAGDAFTGLVGLRAKLGAPAGT